MVDDGERLDRALVGLQIGEPRRVGAPPIALEVPAPVDLLLIDPVELAVQQVGVAVPRQRPLVTLIHGHHDQIVVANERDEGAVRAERRHRLRGRVARQPAHLRGVGWVVVVRAEVVEVGRGVHDHGGVVPVPDEPPGADRPAGGRVAHPGEGGERRLQVLEVEQRLGGPGVGVDREQPGCPARRVALALALEIVRVAEPGEPRRGLAAEIHTLLGVIDLVDGQRPLLRQSGTGQEQHRTGSDRRACGGNGANTGHRGSPSARLTPA